MVAEEMEKLSQIKMLLAKLNDVFVIIYVSIFYKMTMILELLKLYMLL